MPETVRLLGKAFGGFERAVARQAGAQQTSAVATDWLDLPDLERRLFGDRVARTGDVDLVLVVTDWLPRLIENGDLLPLDEFLDVEPPDGWPDGWAPSLRALQQDAAGRTYAIAYHDGPVMLQYRSDLYADNGERTGFEDTYGYPLAAPETWSQFADQARWFTRDGRFGTVLAGYPDGHNNVYDFLTQLWSRGGALLDSAGLPAFGDAAGLESLRFLDALWNEYRVVDPRARSWDSVASGEQFAAGGAALMVNWAGYASLSADPSSSTHGRVACAPVPRGDHPGGRPVSLNVYWVMAVAAGSRRPGAAYRFLRHLASPAMDRITAEEGATATRLSSWRDPAVQSLAPYYSVLEAAHQSAQPLPAVSAWPEVCSVLNTMVDDVINRRADPPTALNTAMARVGAALGTR